MKLTELVALPRVLDLLAQLGLFDHFFFEDVPQIDAVPSCKLFGDEVGDVFSEGAWCTHNKDSPDFRNQKGQNSLGITYLVLDFEFG